MHTNIQKHTKSNSQSFKYIDFHIFIYLHYLRTCLFLLFATHARTGFVLKEINKHIARLHIENSHKVILTVLARFSTDLGDILE